jgi:Inorganic H+ pyrophosphatase
MALQRNALGHQKLPQDDDLEDFEPF